MKTVYSDDHHLHDYGQELSYGAFVPAFEMPRRADTIIARVRARQLGEVIAPDGHGLDPVLRVHDRGLVEFLATAWDEWQKVAPGSRTGEQIYKAICGACHDAGTLGAPKAGDASAWAPRLALGHDGLTKSAIAGKNQMPARGGGSDLTDTEVARAVAYLANTAGAGFTEPPVEAAK